MGYFPTYALGNVLSLQFFERALQDFSDLPEQFARGEFSALLSWFKDKIHRHGRKFTAIELFGPGHPGPAVLPPVRTWLTSSGNSPKSMGYDLKDGGAGEDNAALRLCWLLSAPRLWAKLPCPCAWLRIFGGEIISADSRQVYRGLDIGTDKPSPQEQVLVPHHLLDVVDPDEVLTLAEFQAQAYSTIEVVHRRQRLPMLVGGTGQWVWAVVEGWGDSPGSPRSCVPGRAGGSSPGCRH